MWYDIQRIKGASRLPICLSSYEFPVIVGQWQYRFIMISVHTNLHSHKQNQIHFEFPTKSLSVPQILLMRAKHKRQTLPYTDAYHWFLIPFWFFESPHGLQTADGYPTALPRLGHRLPKNHFRCNQTAKNFSLGLVIFSRSRGFLPMIQREKTHKAVVFC